MLTEAPRQTRRKEARPSEILDAALLLFGEKGYAAASMEDIARQAGVTKGTPYRYFRNKEDLFKELVKTSISPTVAALTQYMEDANALPVAVQLKAIVDYWQVHILATSRSIILKLMVAEAGNFPEVARYYQTEVLGKMTGQLAGLVQLGIDRKEFRPVDIHMVTHSLIAPMVYAVIQKHCFHCEPHGQLGDWLTHAIDLIITGLQASPKTAAPEHTGYC
ncbi:TetR/AcrR family transcriptional regulator [Leeia oryzae]|uniref:TetR/AcrR family transcriptional regulator n=1 Tax=Leeia oryzae TaxID=356662 RepID=UPI00037C0680|nr:TetR/AcrR family transcriptional regulator [Leeia oryzae]